MRGQASIESLFLLLIILATSIFILNLYTQTHNTTIGIGLARTELINLTNSMSPQPTINHIYLEKTSDGNTLFKIQTTPKTLTEKDFGKQKLDEISTLIMQKTNLKKIHYQFNNNNPN